MANLRNKVELLERGVRFLRWLFDSRLLASFTDEQLHELADHGWWPDPMPEPPSWGMSPYDRLDRKTLLRLLEKDERLVAEFASSHPRRAQDLYASRHFRNRHPPRPLQTGHAEAQAHPKAEGRIH